MKHLKFRFTQNSCCWCDTYKIMYLCKESGFVSNCCLLCLDILSVRLRVFNAEESSWSASKAHM